jgi:hypothetical protein
MTAFSAPSLTLISGQAIYSGSNVLHAESTHPTVRPQNKRETDSMALEFLIVMMVRH